jgi:hypothetical protein
MSKVHVSVKVWFSREPVVAITQVLRIYPIEYKLPNKLRNTLDSIGGEL